MRWEQARESKEGANEPVGLAGPATEEEGRGELGLLYRLGWRKWEDERRNDGPVGLD
jgi:hypothetical protein